MQNTAPLVSYPDRLLVDVAEVHVRLHDRLRLLVPHTLSVSTAHRIGPTPGQYRPSCRPYAGLVPPIAETLRWASTAHRIGLVVRLRVADTAHRTVLRVAHTAQYTRSTVLCSA
eukprot:2539220-Rhodomonas_salina.3